MTKTLFPVVSLRAAATYNGDPISAAGFTGGRVFVVASTSSGAATMSIKLQVQDAKTQSWFDIPGAATSTLTPGGSGSATFVVHPAVTSATGAVSQALGNTIRAVAVVASNPSTFGASIDLIR